MPRNPRQPSTIFAACKRLASADAWRRLIKSAPVDESPSSLCERMTTAATQGHLPGYLGDLGRLELARHQIGAAPEPPPPASLSINPRLTVVPVSWQGLPPLLEGMSEAAISPGDDLVLVWRHPLWGTLLTRSAHQADLLALKLVSEDISPREAAATTGISPAIIEEHLRQAIHQGLLLTPPTRLRREQELFDPDGRYSEEVLASSIFTLQWHITQRCDLACRHCYDRSNRREVGLAEGLGILDQLRSFCLDHHVQGQVSFTGGNPFLHEHFFRFYREAADRGFVTAILGNPVGSGQLEEMLEIRMPAYFQVSLEGLEEHNDEIRGPGHFARTLEFLRLLQEMGIPSLVMLTLTRRNMAEVIPLGRILNGLTEGLTFNRLSLTGEGARLQLPDPVEYGHFLVEYAEALAEVPVLALKDNLLNGVFARRGRELFSGCAGHGCGAAFNFLALLPDGEVHACRKFTSPVGSLADSTLQEIYHDVAASRYRQGSAACRGCDLRAVCGGCLAVTRSLGLDPFTDRDPFCLQGPLHRSPHARR